MGLKFFKDNDVKFCTIQLNRTTFGIEIQSGATNLLLKFDDKVQKYSNLLGLSIKARDLMASFEKAETETESPIESAMLRINKAI